MLLRLNVANLALFIQQIKSHFPHGGGLHRFRIRSYQRQLVRRPEYMRVGILMMRCLLKPLERKSFRFLIIRNHFSRARISMLRRRLRLLFPQIREIRQRRVPGEAIYHLSHLHGHSFGRVLLKLIDFNTILHLLRLRHFLRPSTLRRWRSRFLRLLQMPMLHDR